MATNTSLSTAYGVVTDFHKSILDKLNAEQKRTADALAAILAEFPDNAKGGQVYQCAQAMASQTGYNYQLTALRQQYGLDQVPVSTPATTTPTA